MKFLGSLIVCAAVLYAGWRIERQVQALHHAVTHPARIAA